MSKTVLTEGDEGVRLIVKDPKHKEPPPVQPSRSPVHVVYGGADRFSVDTPRKLGRIALGSMKQYAPNFSEFARAFQLDGSGSLPTDSKAIKTLEMELKTSPEKLKKQNQAAWFAWAVHQKTIEKLKREPVEDFRIDFEDGYGFRSEAEEDGHAESAAAELAVAFKKKRITTFSGFRIKSLRPETFGRAVKTLEIFLSTFLDQTSNRLPENFVVTLPKVTDRKQVKELCKRLAKIEKERGLVKNFIRVELMIETPGAVFDKKGRVAVRELVDAAKGRCTSVHFGAYDYTSALGISASHQDIRHPACDLARSVIQIALAGTGVRIVDSVTTQMPVALYKKEVLSEAEKAENTRFVHSGWLRHFQNVSASMANGFYQSWDLHPNQLVARYAAVYAFFLSEMDANAQRLRNYSEKATKATLTRNTFDDAASVAGLVNFFERGIGCGAFSESEVGAATGKSFDKFASR